MAYMRAWRELWQHGLGGLTAAGRRWRGWHQGMPGVAEAILTRLPSPCPACQEAARGGQLCGNCLADVMASRVGATCCDRCGLNLSVSALSLCLDCATLGPACERVIPAMDYLFPADQLLRQFKHRQRFQHSRALGAVMARAVAPLRPVWWPQAWLVPIPASAQALRHRGFNPAAELARQVTVRLGGHVRTDILLRRREAGVARQQKHLSRRLRLQAPDHFFECSRSIAGAHIVLVDDIMTTGATLHGAALTLRQAGAVSVWAVVAARTPASLASRPATTLRESPDTLSE